MSVGWLRDARRHEREDRRVGLEPAVRAVPDLDARAASADCERIRHRPELRRELFVRQPGDVQPAVEERHVGDRLRSGCCGRSSPPRAGSAASTLVNFTVVERDDARARRRRRRARAPAAQRRPDRASPRDTSCATSDATARSVIAISLRVGAEERGDLLIDRRRRSSCRRAPAVACAPRSRAKIVAAWRSAAYSDAVRTERQRTDGRERRTDQGRRGEPGRGWSRRGRGDEGKNSGKLEQGTHLNSSPDLRAIGPGLEHFGLLGTTRYSAILSGMAARRLGIASLITVLLALSGATVAPSGPPSPPRRPRLSGSKRTSGRRAWSSCAARGPAPTHLRRRQSSVAPITQRSPRLRTLPASSSQRLSNTLRSFRVVSSEL